MASYVCYFQSLDLDKSLCFGSFQPNDELNGKLEFDIEVGGPIGGSGVLPSWAKLTMSIPDFKEGAEKYPPDYEAVNLRGAPVGTHKLAIKFGSGSIISIEKNKTEEIDDAHVAIEIKRDTHYASARRWSKLVKLVMSWKNINLVTEGLMNTLDISSISPSICGRAMETFRKLFKANAGTFELYVLDGTIPTLETNLKRLQAAQLAELPENDGPLVARFYKNWGSSSRMLALNFDNLDELQSLSLRPQFKFQPQVAYSNVLELCTRKGVASIEVFENEQEDIKEVWKTNTTMKAVNMDNKNLEYFGAATFSTKFEKKFIVGDLVYLAIDPNTFNNSSSNEKWRGFVCARPGWLYNRNAVCFRFFRPLEAKIFSGSERYYVKHNFLSFKPEGSSNEQWWSAYQKSREFKVQIWCDMSDLTARCQIDGMAAFQLGSFQNFGRNHGTNVDKNDYNREPKQGWTQHTGITKEAEFWCLKDAIPERYVDYLGQEASEYLLKRLPDADHQRVIHYLRKIPNGLGVIQGPAGTGKTWLLAQIVAAKHAGRLAWKTVVIAPSNTPADVAAENISRAFADNPKLQSEYVLRPLPSHRKQQITTSGSMSSKIRVIELTDSFIAGLINDKKNQKDDENREEKSEEKGETRQHFQEVLTALHLFKEINHEHSGKIELMELDPRFISLKSTVGYQCLALAGYENVPRNIKYSHDQFLGFNNLLGAFIASRIDKNAKFNIDDSGKLARIQKELFEYVIRKASVLVSTPATLASRFYVRNVQSQSLDLIFDEAGRIVLPEYASMFASYRPQNRLLWGDIEQLRPIVTIRKLYGCSDENKMSVMESLQKVHWPSVSLFYNRRSAAGLIDVPSKLFYGAQLLSHPELSKCLAKHPQTERWRLFLKKIFPNLTETTGVYVEAMSSDEKKEGGGVFNLGNAALIINVIEKAVLQEGFEAHLFVVIATYKAQVFVYRDVLRGLNKKHPGKGFDEINAETVDAFQGGGCPITLVDFVATRFIGFLNESGRLNVATTRALDGSLTVLRGGLYNPWSGTANWPTLILEEARRRNLSVQLPTDHSLLKNEMVKNCF